MNVKISIFLFLSIVVLSSCGNKKARKITSTYPNETSVNSSSTLLDKYSRAIGTPVYNANLYTTLDEWMGVKYKYGGKSQDGVDCSNFTCIVLQNVFSFPENYYFPSYQLATKGNSVSRSEAMEGDVVCFSISKNNKVSHVGLYLANGKFAHASSSRGVMISSLDDKYYKERLVSIRRLK